jgi:hypothetical protein
MYEGGLLHWAYLMDWAAFLPWGGLWLGVCISHSEQISLWIQTFRRVMLKSRCCGYRMIGGRRLKLLMFHGLQEVLSCLRFGLRGLWLQDVLHGCRDMRFGESSHDLPGKDGAG